MGERSGERGERGAASIAAPAGRERHVVRMAACVALSWLGLYVHNAAELPRLSALSPENSLVALLASALYAVWWALPRSSAAAAALLVWGLLHLVGGGVLSVLPLDMLPYAPEQSVRHYAFHAVYGGAQVPLIVAVLTLFRRQSRSGAQG